MVEIDLLVRVELFVELLVGLCPETEQGTLEADVELDGSFFHGNFSCVLRETLAQIWSTCSIGT